MMSHGLVTPVISFDFVTPRIATGSAVLHYDDAQQLAYAGITHVVDCTWDEADQSIMASHPILSVLWNPTQDDGQHKDAHWFGESIEFGLMALFKPHCKLYTHCLNGRNRGPSTAFAVMLTLGWDYDTAMDLIHTKRPQTVGYVQYATDAANAVRELGYI